MSPLKKNMGASLWDYFSIRAENIATVPVLSTRPNTEITKTTKPWKVSLSVPICLRSTLSFHLSPDIPEHTDPAGIK